jgi:serine/threonine protein kinase
MFFQGTILVERYKLLELLSRGGMGEVWIAEDIVLERKVAIKTVTRSLLENNHNVISVFHDEAKIGASLLGHPNVVSILDYGIHGLKDKVEEYFIVMEYVEGLNLSTFINNVKPLMDEGTYYFLSLLIAWEMGKAIEYAHKQGILHRDIKPLNIFISKYGVTKVGDFGLARFIDMATRTHTVNDFKSPPYSAPEQWKDEGHSKATDIYQLGCTLFHLFTGRLIFEKSRMALMLAHLNEMPNVPKEFCGRMTEELSNVILDMVAKEKNDRVPLWMLNDALAMELQKNFRLHLNVDNIDEETKIKICDILDLERESLDGEEPNVTFPDFNEVLSEGIQLLLNNITCFRIEAITESKELHQV